jgi:hypothetical protein
LLTHLNNLFAEILKVMKLLYLTLCFSQRRGRSERFRDRLALYLPRQPEIRSMAGTSRFGTVAGGFAAFAGSRRDRTSPQISD